MLEWTEKFSPEGYPPDPPLVLSTGKADKFRKHGRKWTQKVMDITQKKKGWISGEKRIYEGSTPYPNDKRRSLQKLNSVEGWKAASGLEMGGTAVRVSGSKLKRLLSKL